MTNLVMAELETVAPPQLRNYRKRRYLGDDLCLPVSAFAPADQGRLRRLYDFLQEMFTHLRGCDGNALGRETAAREFLARQAIPDVLADAYAFGRESVKADESELMGKTTHDLRGGALTALLGWLDLAQMRPPDGAGLRRLFLLTRDHLKIMRNALLGLDDEKRAADLTPQMHGTDLIVEKWTHALLDADLERPVRLEIECGYDGPIAECCVEFGALDRVLYNLVNNASRHCASLEVQVFILPEPAEGTVENLRFAVCNRIADADRQRFGGRDLRELFEPGVSSTGSGLGLTVVADFVSNAFGISREQALGERYLGAKLWNDYFLVWFHWPISPEV